MAASATRGRELDASMLAAASDHCWAASRNGMVWATRCGMDDWRQVASIPQALGAHSVACRQLTTDGRNAYVLCIESSRTTSRLLTVTSEGNVFAADTPAVDVDAVAVSLIGELWVATAGGSTGGGVYRRSAGGWESTMKL